MTLILTLVTLAIVGWLIVTTYLNYRKATGTVWQRLLSAADDSATLLWSKFMLLVSALTGVLTNAADYFGDAVIDILRHGLLLAAGVQVRPEPLPVGETGVSKGMGGGREGDHPPGTGRDEGSGSARKAKPGGRPGMPGRRRATARFTLPRARGGAP